MIVMKFGGTSVGTAQSILQVCELIKQRLDKSPVVVVSAHSGVTNLLYSIGHEALKGNTDISAIKNRHYELIDELDLNKNIIESQLNELSDLVKGISLTKELSLRTLDYVMSFGERLSSLVVAAALTKFGIPSSAVYAYDVGLVTDSNFGNAKPLPQSSDNIAMRFTYTGKVPVVTGYIAKNEDGDITTLGRNGSDFSASYFAAALSAEEIQIFTDVDGVLTADPSILGEAMPIDELSFEEASELAYYGAKVLHPATLVPAVRKNIPVRVLNTHRPQSPGTVIRSEVAESKHTIKSIVYKENIVIFNIASTGMLMAHGFMSKLFGVFANHRISIDMISTSEVTVSLTTDTPINKLQTLIEELNDFADVTVEENKTIVCVVGTGMKDRIGIAGDVFTAIGNAKIPVRMISQGASKINIAFVIDNKDIKQTISALHDLFFNK